MMICIMFLLGLIFTSCEDPKPRDLRIPIIIDADTANEVDDLFALVRAINEPRFNLIGISSAQFHTSPLASDSSVYESQKINEELLALMDRKDILLPLGSNKPLSDRKEYEPSAAVDLIISKAHAMEKYQRLQLVILGSCTNVASAILKDTTIIPKIEVSYIGFWHDVEKNVFDKKEFNSGNDSLAVDVLLNAKDLKFNVMTATTCQHLVFDKLDVETRLKGKGGVADYLVNRWNTYERWWTKEDPEKKQWIMWDVAIIEALIHPGLAQKEAFTTPKENTQRYIQAYTSIEVEAMIEDFWKSFER